MRYRTILGISVLILASCPTTVSAQRAEDPVRFVEWPVADVRAMLRGPGTQMAVLMAGTGVAVVVSSRLDARVRQEAAGITDDFGVRLVQEFGHAKAVRPALTLVFVGSLMAGDTRLQDASFTALESVVVANLVTNALKSVVGRARPWEGKGSGVLEPFSGSTSFPSGHATTAFAAITPFAVYFGGLPGAGLYLLATASAASRLATDMHWFSDVIGGSAIGFITAYTLSGRHRGARGGIEVTPLPAGLALHYRF